MTVRLTKVPALLQRRDFFLLSLSLPSPCFTKLDTILTGGYNKEY